MLLVWHCTFTMYVLHITNSSGPLYVHTSLFHITTLYFNFSIITSHIYVHKCTYALSFNIITLYYVHTSLFYVHLYTLITPYTLPFHINFYLSTFFRYVLHQYVFVSHCMEMKQLTDQSKLLKTFKSLCTSI